MIVAVVLIFVFHWSTLKVVVICMLSDASQGEEDEVGEEDEEEGPKKRRGRPKKPYAHVLCFHSPIPLISLLSFLFLLL